MKLNKLFFLFLILLIITSCSGGGSGGGSGASSATLVSIAVTPANPSIASGTTEQFTATGTYSNGTTQNLTTSVTWSSDTPAVATISNTTGSNGLATTAASTGSATISASSGSIFGYTTLTVTSATLVSIAVTPVNPIIVLGTTKQFTAIGTFSDNTTQGLTALANWSSSSPSVATISNTTGSNGLAASLASGTTTIQAAWNGVSSNAVSLTVIMHNVLPVTVNGSLCSSNSYPNKPCVSVTVCSPGTSNCQTISDILLDTGSYGLRIFKSLLTGLSLTQVNSGSGLLAECIQYADYSANWGPVQTADVILGNEPAVRVPIQIIDSAFGTVPSSCGTPDTDPVEAGFNGILGVGLFAEDCGSDCTSIADNGWYYSCSDSTFGSTCTASTAPLSNQVQNPVAHLPVNNNGVILQLPGISLGGAISVNGSLILGIDTQSNNASSGVTAYPASSIGRFTTVFPADVGTTYNTSFIDSGSNGLFFPNTLSLPTCYSDNWFCPSSTQNLSATTIGYPNSPSTDVSFQIGKASNLFNSPNNVFIELGAPDNTYFDWGLPFFLGRSVYVGIDGKNSHLGTGPYWAY